MASLKLLAIGLLFYALMSGSYWFILWAIIIWEIGGGFTMTTITWISDFSRDDHES